MSEPRAVRAWLVGAVLLGLGATAACSSGGDASSSTPPSPPSSPPATTAPAPSSAAPTTSAPVRTDTSPVTSSAAPSTSAPSRTTTAQPRSTCTSLTVRVLRGSGVTGREFAALQFTNTGASACMLYGYPTVTLSRGGRQVGSASRPADNSTSTYRLAPGDTAESRLNDYVMNCNAPLSDNIRVVAPGSSISSSRPIQLRACLLRTEKLSQPD